MYSRIAPLLPAILLLLFPVAMANEHGEKVDYRHGDVDNHEMMDNGEEEPLCKMIEERIFTCYVPLTVNLPLSKECLPVTAACHPKDEVCTEVVRREVCRLGEEEHGLDKRQASQPLTPGNIPGLVPGSAAEAQWWSQQIAHKGQLAHHIERRQTGPTKRIPAARYPATSYSAPAPSYSTSAPSYSAPEPSYPASKPSYTRYKRQAGSHSSYSSASYSVPAPSYSAPAPSYNAPSPSYSPRPRYRRQAHSRAGYSAPAPKPSYSSPAPTRYKRQSGYQSSNTAPASSYPDPTPT